MIPGRGALPRVLDLKPGLRWTITGWVIIVVPAILYWVIGFLIVVPQVMPVVWDQLIRLGQAVGAAAAAGEVAVTTLGVIQMILLVLPWVGGALLFCMIVNGPLRMAWARWGPARFRVR